MNSSHDYPGSPPPCSLAAESGLRVVVLIAILAAASLAVWVEDATSRGFSAPQASPTRTAPVAAESNQPVPRIVVVARRPDAGDVPAPRSRILP